MAQFLTGRSIVQSRNGYRLVVEGVLAWHSEAPGYNPHQRQSMVLRVSALAWCEPQCRDLGGLM